MLKQKQKPMTPKEKAKELYDKYTEKMNTILDCSYPYSAVENVDLCAKELLVIAVDELINDCDASSPFEEKRLSYWAEVRAEIGAIE